MLGKIKMGLHIAHCGRHARVRPRRPDSRGSSYSQRDPKGCCTFHGKAFLFGVLASLTT